MMRLNTMRPASGSKRDSKRLGRGSGSGTGKTAGRGDKGQKSRSGGTTVRGFEGGQMPLQRRLPKFGFTSRKARFNDEVRLDQLAKLADSGADEIDLALLKAAKLVGRRAIRVKVIASGELDRAIVLREIAATKGARAAIEAAGGRIEP